MGMTRGNSEETQRKLRGNSEETQRKLRGNSEETQRKLRGNSEETQRKLRGNSEETQNGGVLSCSQADIVCTLPGHSIPQTPALSLCAHPWGGWIKTQGKTRKQGDKSQPRLPRCPGVSCRGKRVDPGEDVESEMDAGDASSSSAESVSVAGGSGRQQTVIQTVTQTALKGSTG
uniref:Uncharacterized protein n=1 Tax=Knipowitschia caucasica TaxID=637954 RepID=A0AAV2MUE6_KNICA